MSDFFDFYSVNSSVDKNLFNSTINQLPVKLIDFALISNMRHRAYGVRVHGSDDCTDSCCLNNLARQSLWRILFNIQQQLLGQRKLALAPTYITEDSLVDSLQTTFITQYGAIEKVNVTESYVYVTDITVSPFIAQNINLSATVNGIEARFDSIKVLNPQRAILRKSTGEYTQYPWQHRVGYPYKDGSDWVMLVGDAMSLDDIDVGSPAIHLQDYEYVCSDMPNNSSLDLTKLIAVHPATLQILPFAKPPERVVVNSVTYIRFWFYSWTLGKLEFSNDKTDLVEGEFYKLYSTLPIYRRVETEVPATLYIDQSRDLNTCDVSDSDLDLETETTAWLKVVSSEDGIVRYTQIKDTATTPPANYKLRYDGLPVGRRYKLRYHYKINPLMTSLLRDTSVEEVKRAIVAKAAATIELETCGCACASNDYIQKMQEEYTRQKLDPLSGSVSVQYLYGHRRGDFVFAEVLKSLGQRQPVLIV